MLKFIKSLFFCFLISVLSLFIKNQQIFASELISSFYSRIEVNQDTSLFITEQIDYTTTLNKHGIYRYIPVSYNKDGRVEVLQISNIKVIDSLGDSIQYSRSTDSRFVTLKIGDPDVTFSGNKSYVISYTVERGINQFDNHNELYWDITGEGWKIPIQNSSATIISKYAEIQNVACYSGAVGSDDGLCNFETGQNQATFFYENQINYGDNMTVVLSFPKNSYLVFPTKTKLYLLWLKNNWSILLLPFPLLIMFIWWFKKGRDIEFISQNVFDLDPNKPTKLRLIKLKAREPMVYEPLKDLTPGEAGALLNEKVDVQDVVAEILELARKKYLKISVIEKKTFFSTKRDYEFEKLTQKLTQNSRKQENLTEVQEKKKTSAKFGNSSQQLTEVQEYLLKQLFLTGNKVKLSSLKGKFYLVINNAKSKINLSLTSKNIYTSNPVKQKSKGIVLYLLMIGAIFFLYQLLLLPLGIYWPLLFLFSQVPVGLFLGYNLTQKSAVGTNLWLQTRGLRATIKRGAWREKIKEKNLFIEEVLPFAVALGVVKQLSNDMKDLDMQAPDYISTTGLTSLAMADFVGSFSKEVGSTLSYNPSSSSSSGGSGFSGGSSGGGGGGGGGGSW